jgi:hypothetical protein
VESDVQPPDPSGQPDDDPAEALLAAAAAVAPDWLRRITTDAAAAGGVDGDALGGSLQALVESESARLLVALRDLLVTDVDLQTTNPLSLFRAAVAEPTRLLQSVGATPPALDRFTAERFPEDVFGLGPATWADVDPSLHEPGLRWGAWKAMTVLRRRRDEGLR